MGPDHEYSLLSGTNRSRIGRTLGMIAGAIAAAIVFIVLALVDLATKLGLQAYVPQLILWPIGAGAVYLVLYAIFDKYLWKVPILSRLLKLPNLAGEWNCEGQSLNPDKSPSWTWSGTARITQSWDRIKVRIHTSQSRSVSIAAALLHDEADGYRLIYHYQNTPNVDEPELHVHRGFAELTFSSDGRSAKGEYFNGQGRFTFGKISLRRL